MGKYSKYAPPPKESEGMHPIWRGIGCLMIIILPALSYTGAIELLNYGLSKYWPIPAGILGFIRFPDWVWKVPLLAGIARPIATYQNLYAVLIFTLVILVFLSGIFSLFYSILYRVIGPPRLTPMDAPPIKNRKVKKSR
jgi:hypothetical protein